MVGELRLKERIKETFGKYVDRQVRRGRDHGVLGSPFVDERQHAMLAYLAALEQLERLVEFHKALPELVGVRKAVPEFHVRIGLATGDVVIGNIGSENIKGYTVMGDTVNLGSRLEGASKQYGTAILISEQMQAMVAASAIESRELDFIRAAGKTEPARVFELMARRGELSAARGVLRDRFHEGLVAYRAGEWDHAEQHFRACLAAVPADRPSRVFLERVAHLRGAPPASWDGVWTLEHK